MGELSLENPLRHTFGRWVKHKGDTLSEFDKQVKGQREWTMTARRQILSPPLPHSAEADKSSPLMCPGQTARWAGQGQRAMKRAGSQQLVSPSPRWGLGDGTATLRRQQLPRQLPPCPPLRLVLKGNQRAKEAGKSVRRYRKGVLI